MFASLAPCAYLITLSARAITFGEIVRPIWFAGGEHGVWHNKQSYQSSKSLAKSAVTVLRGHMLASRSTVSDTAQSSCKLSESFVSYVWVCQ